MLKYRNIVIELPVSLLLNDTDSAADEIIDNTVGDIVDLVENRYTLFDYPRYEDRGWEIYDEYGWEE